MEAYWYGTSLYMLVASSFSYFVCKPSMEAYRSNLSICIARSAMLCRLPVRHCALHVVRDMTI